MRNKTVIPLASSLTGRAPDRLGAALRTCELHAGGWSWPVAVRLAGQGGEGLSRRRLRTRARHPARIARREIGGSQVAQIDALSIVPAARYDPGHE